MSIKNKKFIILTFILTLSANLYFKPSSLADDQTALYSSKLRKIDISNQLNNNFIINIHSDKKIIKPINIKQTSDKSFIITIPESFLLDDTLIYNFSQNNFFSSKIQYFPYLSNNDSYGYTNIYIDTIQPIDFDKFNILNTYYKEINTTNNLALSENNNKTNALTEKPNISKKHTTEVIVKNYNNTEKKLKINEKLSLNNSDKIIQKSNLNYKQKDDIIKKDNISLEKNNLKKNSDDNLILEEKFYNKNKIEDKKNIIDIKNIYLILYLLPILLLLMLFRKLKITNKIIESMKIMGTENKVINLESFFDTIANSTEETHIYNFMDELAEKNKKEEQEHSKESTSDKIDESSLPELQLNDCQEIVIINKNESSRFNNLSNEDDEDNPIELDLDKEDIDDLLPDEIIDNYNNLTEEPAIDLDKEILDNSNFEDINYDDNLNINQEFLNKNIIINKNQVYNKEKNVKETIANDSKEDYSSVDVSFEDSKPIVIDEEKINALESQIEQHIDQEIQKVNDYIQASKKTSDLKEKSQDQQQISSDLDQDQHPADSQKQIENNVSDIIEDSSFNNESKEENNSLDNDLEINQQISPSFDKDSSFEDSKPIVIDEEKINALESQIEQHIDQEIQKVNDYIQASKKTSDLKEISQDQQQISSDLDQDQHPADSQKQIENNVSDIIEDSSFNNESKEENDSIDNDPEINQDNLNLIYSQELSDNKFLYLINYTDTNALIGEVNGNISVIKRFEHITNPIIKARIQDQKQNKETYIVKANGAKLLIESNDSKMSLLMEL